MPPLRSRMNEYIYPAALRCVYSSDFENMDEVNIGNVKYPAVFPTDGGIVFDADFESGLFSTYFYVEMVQSVTTLFKCIGNLGRVDMISDGEYDLFIRPDTCNSKYRVWFYFECCNAVENQVGSRFSIDAGR